ncbi:methylcrotonoyl-CoA carboxylase subunit alpha, mitochondrial-like [Watersipora subatra]|uniref:methylcrotonoyl-CoA carboxylase subunit alpha, mitochondrial-like n=1 Tax=Watersipora subatra TaxID=2589382 RepID=UPI00355C5059
METNVRIDIIGLNTNINFMLSLAKHPEFQLGNVHTSFIPQHNDSLFPKKDVTHEELLLAVTCLLSNRRIGSPNNTEAFSSLASARFNHNKEEIITLQHDSTDRKLRAVSHGDGSLSISEGDVLSRIEGKMIKCENTGRSTAVVESNGRVLKCDAVVMDNNVYLFTEHGLVHLTVPLPKYQTSDMAGATPSDALAPMPGVVDKVFVQPGERVEEGQPMLVMIAMKMEYVIKAPRAGLVETVPFQAGTTVQKGARLVHIAEES